MRHRRLNLVAVCVLAMGSVSLLTPETASADEGDCIVCVSPTCPSVSQQNDMCYSGNCGPSRDDCGPAGSQCDGWSNSFHCARNRG
jgi:hypothetical protein